MSGDTSSKIFSVIFRDAYPDCTQAKIWLILWNLWIDPDMLFFSMSVCNICAMAENNPGRVRPKHVSQTASVQRERVTTRTARPRVYDNSFDGSQPPSSQCWGSQPSGYSSHCLLSQVSTSRGHDFVDDVADPETPEAQEEAATHGPLESYLGGPFDISLLHLYADHAAKHVWEWEVYIFSFAIYIFSTN